MLKLDYVVSLIIMAFFSIVTLFSCSTPKSLVSGHYFSQGEYIIEHSNTDGWRQGHYLLTIDSSDTFVLKEVSVGLGMLYRVCSGHLQCQGVNTYSLEKIKVEYPYGALGNPYHIDDNYFITIKDRNTIILQKGRWKTTLKCIPQDSVPNEFDFTKYGYGT